MKLFAGLILILSCYSIACSKTVSGVSKNDIAGEWLLIEYSGGFAGGTYIPKDINTITFETSGKYFSSLNDTIKIKGTYDITKAPDGSDYYSETIINISADNGNKFTYGITLQHDSLILSEGCCDQFSYTYIRQK